MYFSGFLNEWLIFYELFCEGPSALRKYALTAVRGLRRVVMPTLPSRIFVTMINRSLHWTIKVPSFFFPAQYVWLHP